MTNTVADPTPSRTHWERVWQSSTITRPIHTHMLAAIASAMDLSSATTLEIGCGSAVDSAELSALGAKAFASDFSRYALQHAAIHSERRGTVLHLAAGDTLYLPYRSDTFDVVFSQGLLEHFPDPVPALLEQIRVLRPGGILCVDVPQTFSLLTLYKRWHMMRGTWFAGWETNFTLTQLEGLLRAQGMEVVHSYGWMYFPSIAYGVRNLHTLNERHHIPIWLGTRSKQLIEKFWTWLERQRWYYRWLGCVGVIGRKPAY